ncbi:hypothetical protein ANCCEY_15306, partial [Ancylostoma ceylanicum]
TYPLALGILSAFAEAIAIAAVSIFFFKSTVEFGIISGFLLATVSPAVCGPVMMRCQRLGIGTDKTVVCCILVILITAPIGAFVLDLCAPRMLQKAAERS